MMLTLLPVQVISASIENSNMQMQSKMSHDKSDCMHQHLSEHAADKACCDEHSKQCNNCPPVISAVVLTTLYETVHPSLKKQVLFISHLLLNGTPQKNLLRPPRNII